MIIEDNFFIVFDYVFTYMYILMPHNMTILCFHLPYIYQSARSPKVVALFSATNFSSYIIELLQMHDTFQIE